MKNSQILVHVQLTSFSVLSKRPKWKFMLDLIEIYSHSLLAR